MDKNELSKLPVEQLAEAILLMGHIIRRLDEDSEYLDYWTQDGEYIIYIPGKEVIEHLMVCPICKKEVNPVAWASQPLKVCPDCGNVIESKDCACLDKDARRCFEKRYVGTTKENQVAMADEKCECPCHDRQDEDGEDEDGE